MIDLKRLLTITLLLGSFYLQLSAQPSANPGIDESKQDTAYIEGLFVRAQDVEGEPRLNLLSEALNISEFMDYNSGLERGYHELINYYHDNEQVAEEVWSRYKLGAMLEEAGETEAYVNNTLETGELYFNNEFYGKARDAYLEAINYGNNRDLPPDLETMKRLAWSQHLADDLGSAEKSYQRAISRARKEANGDELLWLHQKLGGVYHDGGKHGAEYRISKRIFALADSLGKKEESIYALNNIGYAAKFAKQGQNARMHFDSVLKALSPGQNRALEGFVNQNLGVFYQNEGDYVRSIYHMQEAVSAFKASGREKEEAEALDMLSLIYHQTGDSYNSLFHLNRSIELSKNKFPRIEASSHRTKSLVHQATYEYKEAFKSFEKYLSIRDSIARQEVLRRARIQQDQYRLERDEKRLSHLHFVEKQRALENEREKAEKQAALEREAKLTKENQLKDAQLKNKDLALLNQARERALVQAQFVSALDRRRADSLAQAEALAQANLRISEQEADSIQRVKEKLDAETALQQTQLANEKLRTRNLLYLMGGLGAVILLILFILAQLRRKNSKINKQNLIIAAEREKSDGLLLNILPPAIAAELKDSGAATPRDYEAVSVLFTDFKGFTKIAERLNPTQLVAKLNEIFGKFDEISNRHGLYRIKTIGDAYMAASGLPETDPSHATKAVNAALEMRDFLERFNSSLPSDAPKWNIRIGVNSGPVVAGVVGTGKFAYDIWGDAVNTASRMESSGAPGKVNISGDTFEIVKNRFTCEYRGKIPAKNKGEIDMYFVEHKGA